MNTLKTEAELAAEIKDTLGRIVGRIEKIEGELRGLLAQDVRIETLHGIYFERVKGHLEFSEQMMISASRMSDESVEALAITMNAKCKECLRLIEVF